MYNPNMLMWMARLAATILFTTTATLIGAAPDLATRITQLTRATEWTRRDAIPIRFKTHHPQGLVKIGDQLFLSSVEVLDRAAGKGVGHLFQFDISGKLIAQLTLGEGAIYHPGGLDYDGRYIWVAVAEYRPNSRSIVYRIDPRTMTASEIFRFGDHLGALVHDTETHSLHAVSWGSRVFYKWPLSRDRRVQSAAQPMRIANPSHYIDYQDCKFAGQGRMACTGVTEFRVTPGSEPFRLGGIDLVSLRDHRPIHQVPLLLWTRGLDLTHNPVWLEATASGLRGYFIPEDDDSTLYVYETK